MKKKLTVFLLCVLLVLAAGCGPSETSDPLDSSAPEVEEPPRQDEARPLIPDDAMIATLGDETVPAIDYIYLLTHYKSFLEYDAMMSGYGPGVMEEFWGMDQGGMTLKQMLLGESMRSAKEYAILYNAAVLEGMRETDEAAAAADDLIAGLLEQMEGDRQAFLETYNLTPEQMREAMRRASLVADYYTHALESITVSEQEMRELYDEMGEQFDLVTVRHVLILSNSGMSEQEQEAAKLKAEDILTRLNAGADIGELAAEHSEDPGSKDNNGEYTFGRGEMVAEFEEWSYAAQPGDTGVVQTTYGHHVMQKIGGSRIDYEEVDQRELEQRVRGDKFDREHRALYDRIESAQWVINQPLVDQITALIQWN